MTTASTITVRRAAGALGATVTGVDLNDLDDATFAAIHGALLEHCVLHIPGQDLSPAAHKAFGERFGPLHTHPAARGVEGHPEILLLENRGKERTITEVWHSDVTCEQRPPSISILHARVLPEYGGDTMWANQYLAYEQLSTGLRRMLDGMRAVHSAFELESTHPVVRTHPETGRKALFVNAGFTRRFEDMTVEESRPLLRYLVEQASVPDLTYRHHWSPGDVVMWDNRATMHRGRPWPPGEARLMIRTTISASAADGVESMRPPGQQAAE